MHRRNLLCQLKTYQKRYPDEARTISQFRDFIEMNTDCFERDCWAGHITGSAWLVNQAGTHVLLTHHKKLDRWLQLGGHSDGDTSTLSVALREAREESGLEVGGLVEHGGDIFDIDIHEIPAHRNDPAHYHYDIRFVLRAEGSEKYSVSDESHDLAWVSIEDIETYTKELSILRMKGKWPILNSNWVEK